VDHREILVKVERFRGYPLHRNSRVDGPVGADEDTNSPFRTGSAGPSHHVVAGGRLEIDRSEPVTVPVLF
jgi:hypothetical protein